MVALPVVADSQAPTGSYCTKSKSPPEPPPRGAVIWAEDDGSTMGNTLVLAFGQPYTDANDCYFALNEPKAISVAPGGALVIYGFNLVSGGSDIIVPWGAVTLAQSDTPPDFLQYLSFGADEEMAYQWEYTKAVAVIDPVELVGKTSSCRHCDLSGTNLTLPGRADTLNGPVAAFAGDLSGSNLRGATISGNGRIFNFGGSDLSDVSIKPGTSLDDASFAGVTASLGLFQQVVVAMNADIRNWADARLLVTESERKILAGADLHGVNLSGASFLGEALDLTGTVFDGANLAKTNFGPARLSGASFANVTAPGASFLGANLAADGPHPAANFSGANTHLEGANFVNANLAGAKFVGAELGGASFSGARAVGTDFSGVRAPGAIFAGAHVYGDGQAFNNATDLQGADFTGAVLASDVNQGGGFDFTGAALNGAHFDNVVCVACNFTNATLTAANFTGAYLPGAELSGALLGGASFDRAWFYCGDPSNGACTGLAGSPPRWSWPLALSSDEVYGPVPFAQADLAGVNFDDVATCPDGKPGAINPAGCEGHLLPDPANAPAIPAPCSASADGACPTPTSTLNDSASIGTPLAVVPRAPPTWNTLLPGEGYFVAFDDGTIRLIGVGKPQTIAGTPGRHCPAAADSCGDGGQAAAALLGTPSGLAVGLDGSLYIADSALHRVRRIDPTGTISTVAGSGAACAAGSNCGDGGPATAAALAGPNGVWVDTRGVLLIADVARGVRRVASDGTLSTLMPGSGSLAVMAVVGNADGVIFATIHQPDALIRIDPATGKATTVVGTGTSGYNGNTDALGNLLPGNQVQVNGPVGLALENDGKILFADTGNHLIRAFVPATGHVVDDLAGKVANGVPLVGFNGDGRWANDTLLHSPLGVAATRGALMVVADSANRRVRQVGPVPVSATVSAERPTALLTCGPRPIQSCRRMPLPPQALQAKRTGAVTISDEGTVLATGWRLESEDGQVRFLVTEQRPLLRDHYHFAIRWPREPRARQIRVR